MGRRDSGFDITRFRSGDRLYARQIVEEHSPLVRLICGRYAADYDHACDLAQEVWIKVHESGSSYRGSGPFHSWLARLANNVCISDQRSRKRLVRDRRRYAGQLTDADLTCYLPDAWAEGEPGRIHRLVRRAFDDLPPREKQALTLRIIERKRPRAVAADMGITPGTVRSHIHHALRRLRARMDDPADPLSALIRFRTGDS